MKRVITYGSFDLFHFGHIALLKRAKNLGDYLIVGLSSDEFHKSKGKSAFYTYEQRKIFLDWTGKFDFLKKHCEVVYLPRTAEISTSKIKSYMNLNSISTKF